MYVDECVSTNVPRVSPVIHSCLAVKLAAKELSLVIGLNSNENYWEQTDMADNTDR